MMRRQVLAILAAAGMLGATEARADLFYFDFTSAISGGGIGVQVTGNFHTSGPGATGSITGLTGTETVYSPNTVGRTAGSYNISNTTSPTNYNGSNQLYTFNSGTNFFLTLAYNLSGTGVANDYSSWTLFYSGVEAGGVATRVHSGSVTGFLLQDLSPAPVPGAGVLSLAFFTLAGLGSTVTKAMRRSA